MSAGTPDTPDSKTKVKAWVEALRLRSLPLSVGGILVAGGLASYYSVFRWSVFLMALLAAVLLQVLANFADEYGDLDNGADNEGRIGPIRGMQRGDISREEMKRGMLAIVLMCAVLFVALMWASFGPGAPASAGHTRWGFIALYTAFALLCIAGAVFYTVGDHPYGYYGLGDVACFLFFGLMSVSGGFVLFAQTYVATVLLPSIGVGLLVVGMISINNMRDLENDAATGKRTMAVLLGRKGALVYHICVVLFGLGFLLAFPVAQGCPWWDYAFVLFYIPELKILLDTVKAEPVQLDRCMKPHSLCTALICLAFALCLGL